MNNAKRVSKILMIVTMVIFAMNFVFAKKDVVAAESAPITIPVMVNETDNISALPKYDVDVPMIKDEYIVVPIVATVPGQLYINTNAIQIEKYVYLKLFTDKECNYTAGFNSYIDPNEVKTFSMAISKAGTYYLKVWHSSTVTAPSKINITPYMLARTDQTLTLGAWSRIMAPSYSSEMTYHKVVVPSDGYIGIEAKLPSTYSLFVTLCRGDKTEIVNASPSTGDIVKYHPVTKGTYYFKTKGSYNEWSRIRCSFVKGQFSLKEKQYITFSSMNSTTNMDIKFKAEKTGLLVMNGVTSGWSSYVTLLSAKGVELTDSTYYSGSRYMGFAVKKGTTYYLRVRTSSANGASYSIKGTTQGKNKTKKKATTLKKNKKKVGLLIAGEKTKYWYKFKMTKKKMLQINIATSGSGSYTSRVVDKKGRTVYITSTDGVVKSIRKLAKGTYYYVIEPKTKSSGRFEVTLK